MTVSEVSHVLGGYNYGMMITCWVGGPLSDILGGKWLLVVVTLLSTLSTALVPLLADLSVAWLVVSQAEWSSLIGPDCLDRVISLVEPYYAGAKVYAITTLLKASKLLHTRSIFCLSLCCYDMNMIKVASKHGKNLLIISDLITAPL